MESASSFSTSCSEVACEVQPKRGVADGSLAFKFGRSGSKTGPSSQLRGQSAGRTQSRNCRRADQRRRSMYGVSCHRYGRFDVGQWGNGSVSPRRSHKSPTTDRSRGRRPRLRSLKRACWSDITMAGSPRTGRMRRMMLPSSTRTILVATAVVTQHRRDGGSETPVHATSESAEQCPAGGELHKSNTSRKN
jgi:hypothetical protein